MPSAAPSPGDDGAGIHEKLSTPSSSIFWESSAQASATACPAFFRRLLPRRKGVSKVIVDHQAMVFPESPGRPGCETIHHGAGRGVQSALSIAWIA